MRIRILGQHVPASLGVLALIEASLAFLALYAAVLIRFNTPLRHLSNLERELGPLWPRALAYGFIVTTPWKHSRHPVAAHPKKSAKKMLEPTSILALSIRGSARGRCGTS